MRVTSCKKRAGFGPILVALGIVSLLSIFSLVAQLTNIRVNKRIVSRIDSLEGFYSGEIAAWHYFVRDQEGLAAQSRQQIALSNTYVSQVNLEKDPIGAAGSALNVATTRDYMSMNNLVRRHPQSAFEYFNKNGALCGGQFGRVACLYAVAPPAPRKRRGFFIGGTAAAFLTDAGQLFAWGTGSDYSFSWSIGGMAPTPVLVDTSGIIPQGDKMLRLYRAASANLGTACVITELGASYCSGMGGTRGDGSSAVNRQSRMTQVITDHLGANVKFTDLYGGSFSTASAICGRLFDKRIICWGLQEAASMGVSASSDSVPIPQQMDMSQVIGNPDIIGLRLGGMASGGCLITVDKIPHCWGLVVSSQGFSSENLFIEGQWGSPRPVPLDLTSNRPSRFYEDKYFDNTLTCYSKTQGIPFFCWGGEDRDSFFSGFQNLETFTPLSDLSLMPPSKKISDYTTFDRRHFVISTVDNKIYAWGDNEFSHLAISSPDTITRPTPIESTLEYSSLSGVDSPNTSCAMSLDYQPYCWGTNLYGQFGDNGPVYPYRAVPGPVQRAWQ